MAADELGASGVVGGGRPGMVAVLGEAHGEDVLSAVTHRAWELYNSPADLAQNGAGAAATTSYHFRGWAALPLALLHPLWASRSSPLRPVLRTLGRIARWSAARGGGSRPR